MPTVKIYTRRETLQPLPAVRRQEYKILQLDTPPGPVSPTAASFGAGFGATMAEVGLQWSQVLGDRRSQLQLQKAAEGLDKWELTRLDQPDTGLLATVKGDQAHTLLETVPKEFKDVATELRKGLNGHAAQDGFDQYVGKRELEITRKLQGHVLREEEIWAKAQSEATVATAQFAAVANVNDMPRSEREISRIPDAIETDANMHGLPADYVKLKTSVEVSKARAMVLDALLGQGQDLAATAYFKQHETDFKGDTHTAFQAKLETANSESLGTAGADEIWKTLGPRSDSDPVNIDQMKDKAREAMKEPRIYKAAAQSLEERANAFDKGREERASTSESTVWKAVKDGASTDDVGKMPAYLNLPGSRQIAVRNAIVNDLQSIKERARGDQSYLWEQGQRARTSSEQAEQDRTKAAFGSYLRLSEPNELVKHSEAQLENLLPSLGDKLTQDLIERRRALDNPAKVRNATIDDSLFDTIADRAGLKAFAKPAERSDTDNARLGMLKNSVLAGIAQEEKAKGRELTRDEKTKVISDQVDQKVILSVPFFRPGPSSISVPASTLRPGETGVPRVDISKIPDIHLSDAVNYMKSLGIVPQGLSRGAALQQYGDRIERAYAAHLDKKFDEEEQILQGR